MPAEPIDHARNERSGAIRSLLLSPVPLDRATDGTRIRARSIANALTQCGTVHSCCFEDEIGGNGDVALPSRPTRWERLFSPTPSLVKCFQSTEFGRLVTREASQSEVCVCIGLQMMQYSDCLPAGMPILLDNFNVECDIIELLADRRAGIKRAYWRMQAARLHRFEAWALRRADINMAISTADAARFSEIALGAEVRTVPPGLNLEPYFDCRSTPMIPGRIVFIASLGWHVNVDAAIWMACEVFPRIVATNPSASLALVGRNPACEVSELGERPGVSVHANVPDILPWLSSASVVVAPLRYGSGVQTKVIEAMAAGKAIVTTPVGAEGIEAVHGEHMLVAESVQGFADCCVDLLQNPDRADNMGIRAREASRRYSFDRLAEDTRRIILEMVAQNNG